MRTALTPAQRQRLQAAADQVGEGLRSGLDAATIIGELVRHHRATFRAGDGTYRLGCAGVAASCTWSKDKGLIDAWRRNATLRLMGEGAR